MEKSKNKKLFSRREFLAGGGAIIALGTLSACTAKTSTVTSTTQIPTTSTVTSTTHISTTSTVTSTTQVPTTVTTTKTTTAPTPTPVTGGVLKIGASVDGSNIGNPGGTAMNQFDFGYAGTCIEMLVRIDATGTVVPCLATSWKQDPAVPSITFTLRQGVKFHDGTDWDATAAAWNLNNTIASKARGTSSMDSATMIDKYTVQLKLKQWDTTVIYFMATTYIGLMVSPTAYQANGATAAAKNPVGTGPFQFSSWQQGTKIVFKKFSGYWQPGQPIMDEIDWIIIADPMTKVMSLEAGEVDLITEVDFPSAKILIADQGNYTASKATTAFFGIAGDSKNASSPSPTPRSARQ